MDHQDTDDTSAGIVWGRMQEIDSYMDMLLVFCCVWVVKEKQKEKEDVLGFGES